MDRNPKTDTGQPSNRAKDPDDWVTGDETMTGAQGRRGVRSKPHQGGSLEADRRAAGEDRARP